MTDKSTMTLVIMALLMLGAAAAQAQTYTTLFNFNGSDGWGPLAGVIQDPAGNLYGTTQWGPGANGPGVVYEVNTAGTETVLYTFCSKIDSKTQECEDGANPIAPLVRDSEGNLYGTTLWGGVRGGRPCHDGGCGTIFKIDTNGEETVLHGFRGKSDGCIPSQGLLMDHSGNLYGTTVGTLGRGGCGNGTIFRVDSKGKFTLLHSFAGGSSDGAEPYHGHLIMDTSGNLYGVTTAGGGAGCGGTGCGVLYKLSKSGTLTLLHSFAGGTSDGCTPAGSVVQDEAGNFYGTTQYCGSNNGGTIWEVSANGEETILHNFAGGPLDGWEGEDGGQGVTRDSEGNLYGVTPQGGANDLGALYELSVSGTLMLLHSFGYDHDDADPWCEVLRTANGTLFGTTTGGPGGPGSVWSYVP